MFQRIWHVVRAVSGVQSISVVKLKVKFSLYYSAFSLDAEQPDYDLDSEDEVFVNKLKKRMDISPLQFEEMIDRLEKGSGQQVQRHFELKKKKTHYL